jgi:hypothetical protein
VPGCKKRRLDRRFSFAHKKLRSFLPEQDIQAIQQSLQGALIAPHDRLTRTTHLRGELRLPPQPVYRCCQ